jgi:hypothetical protein
VPPRSETKWKHGGDVKHDCLEDSAPLRSACIECLGSCKRSYDARVRPDLAACLTNNRGRMPRDISHLPHILDSLDFAGILVVVLGVLSITGQRAVLGGDEEGRRRGPTTANHACGFCPPQAFSWKFLCAPRHCCRGRCHADEARQSFGSSELARNNHGVWCSVIEVCLMHVIVTLYVPPSFRCCNGFSTRRTREPSQIPLRLRPDSFEFAQ